jgi:hypothetical protein
VVASAFVALAAVIVAWTAIDRRPPEWDHANHLERAVQCARDFSAGDWRAIVEQSSFYPPLVTCTAALARRLAPSEAVAAESVMENLKTGSKTLVEVLKLEDSKLADQDFTQRALERG